MDDSSDEQLATDLSLQSEQVDKPPTVDKGLLGALESSRQKAASPVRAEQVANAVAFLTNPKVMVRLLLILPSLHLFSI
jgi:hypothetical protein